MISNERPSPYTRRPAYFQPKFSPPKPRSVEATLHSCELQIERKLFVLALKENPRGRFLRITELRNPRAATIIIPLPGLQDFQKILAGMLQAESEIPPLANAPKPE